MVLLQRRLVRPWGPWAGGSTRTIQRSRRWQEGLNAGAIAHFEAPPRARLKLWLQTGYAIAILLVGAWFVRSFWAGLALLCFYSVSWVYAQRYMATRHISVFADGTIEVKRLWRAPQVAHVGSHSTLSRRSRTSGRVMRLVDEQNVPLLLDRKWADLDELSTILQAHFGVQVA
jgi:hypothetical protein